MAVLKGGAHWPLWLAAGAMMMASACTPVQSISSASGSRVDWNNLSVSPQTAGTANIKSLIRPGIY